MFRMSARALCLVALLSVATSVVAQPADGRPDGPVFTPEQMTAGITMTAEECSVFRSTVYVMVQGTGLCFRYYLSTAGGDAAQAVYVLDGDKSEENRAFDPATFDRRAALLSNEYRRPVVLFARMGLDGSSGNHRYRRTWFEVEATHRAIDAINARHGFRAVHLIGQAARCRARAGWHSATTTRAARCVYRRLIDITTRSRRPRPSPASRPRPGSWS